MTRGEMRAAVKLRMGMRGGGLIPDDIDIDGELNISAVYAKNELVRMTRRTIDSDRKRIVVPQGAQDVSLPDNLLRRISMRAVSDSDPGTRIRMREINEIDAYKHIGRGNIDPDDGAYLFYMRRRNIITLPEPAIEPITIDLSYETRPLPILAGSIDNDGQTFDIPPEFHELVVWRTMVSLAYADSDMLDAASAMYDRCSAQALDTLESTRTGEFEGHIQLNDFEAQQMARDSSKTEYLGPFIGLRVDVHPSQIGPAMLEDCNNVLCHKGRIIRRKGWKPHMPLGSGLIEFANKLAVVGNQDPAGLTKLLAITGVIHPVSRVVTSGAYVVDAPALSTWASLSVTPTTILPYSTVNVARFDDYVLIAGKYDETATRMPAYKLGDAWVRAAGLARAVNPPIIGKNNPAAYAAPKNHQIGAAPRYMVCYYDSTRGVESGSLASQSFEVIRFRVTSTHVAWPGVGGNITFSTPVRPIHQRFDNVVIRIESNSTKGVNYMYGVAVSDDGTNLTVTCQFATGSPNTLTDLDVSIQPYTALTRQAIYFKAADPDVQADYVRIYRAELGDTEFYLVEEKLISSLSAWSGDASYKEYVDNIRAENRTFSRKAPLYNDPPPMAEIVVNHNGVAVFFNVAGENTNLVFFGQPPDETTGQTGAHYANPAAFFPIPFEPNETRVTGALSIGRSLIVFTESGALQIDGDFVIDNAGQTNLSISRLAHNGNVTPNLCLTHRGRYFHADRVGVFANGEKLSGPIEPIWRALRQGAFDLAHMEVYESSEHKWLVITATCDTLATTYGWNDLTYLGNPQLKSWTPIYPGVFDSSTAVTIGAGSKTFTTINGHGLLAGSRILLRDKGDNLKWMWGTVTAVNVNSITFNAKNFRGTGSSSSWYVEEYAPYPNMVLIFNLDPTEEGGGGWVIWRDKTEAICASLLDNPGGSLFAAIKPVTHTPEIRGALVHYGSAPGEDRTITWLDFQAVGVNFFAIPGSMKLTDIRHSLHFNDITVLFDDPAGDGTARLQFGFAFGRGRHNESLAAVPPQFVALRSIAGGLYHDNLALDARAYRGWPWISGTDSGAPFVFDGYYLSYDKIGHS